LYESKEATSSGQQQSVSQTLHIYQDQLFFVSAKNTVKYLDLSLLFDGTSAATQPDAVDFCPDINDVQDIGFSNGCIYVLQKSSLRMIKITAANQVRRYDSGWKSHEIGSACALNATCRILTATAREVYVGIGIILLCFGLNKLQPFGELTLSEPITTEKENSASDDNYGLISQITDISTSRTPLVMAVKFSLHSFIVGRIGDKVQILAVLRRQAGTSQGRTFGSLYCPSARSVLVLGEFNICQFIQLPKLL
jgi:hypothetical protein